MRLVILIVPLLLAFTTHAPRLKQGIKGQVFWLSGNQMPGPGVRAAQQGIVREIHIYKVARLEDVVQADGFYTDVKTELVAKTWSATDGTFKVRLPPGEYSLFTKEEKGLFANLFDRDNRINPITVRSKKFTWVSIAIDYEAAY